MKTLNLLAAAALVAVPALTFAQSIQAPVTRAQVVADLVRVEKAGYDPAGNSDNYPADIQAAEAKVAASEGIPAVQPETRAQVRKDLLQVEKAGYNPFRVSNDYPADIQAAEAKLSAQATTTVSTASTVSTATQPRVVKMASVQGGQATYRIDRPRNPFFDGA